MEGLEILLRTLKEGDKLFTSDGFEVHRYFGKLFFVYKLVSVTINLITFYFGSMKIDFPKIIGNNI